MHIPRNLGPKISADINYNQKDVTSNKAKLKDSISNRRINDDTISISNEARAIFEKEKGLIDFNEQPSIITEMLEQLNEPSNKSEDSTMDKIKCIIIASRIIKGDRVPMKDRKFLAEKEPEMYLKALLLRKQNKKPKKHKSLLKDEEDNNTPKTTKAGPNRDIDFDDSVPLGPTPNEGDEIQGDIE